MRDEEKKEMLLDMARNMSKMRDDYKPHLVDGQIQHSSPCILKSTLKGRQAWSDDHVVMVYKDGDVHSQIPEYRAEGWHRRYDSFDFLADAVLTSQPIHPVLYDDIGLWFNNGASIQRAYYDIFWVTHRHANLRFEQDKEEVNSVILVYDDSGLIGVIMPRSFEPEREAEILPLIKLLIDYHEYATDDPCAKCGAKEDVWLFAKNREIKTDGIPICHWCYLDTEGFTERLKEEIEDAVESSDEYEKMPDGKYRKKLVEGVSN